MSLPHSASSRMLLVASRLTNIDIKIYMDTSSSSMCTNKANLQNVTENKKLRQYLKQRTTTATIRCSILL